MKRLWQVGETLVVAASVADAIGYAIESMVEVDQISEVVNAAVLKIKPADAQEVAQQLVDAGALFYLWRLADGDALIHAEAAEWRKLDEGVIR